MHHYHQFIAVKVLLFSPSVFLEKSRENEQTNRDPFSEKPVVFPMQWNLDIYSEGPRDWQNMVLAFPYDFTI